MQLISNYPTIKLNPTMATNPIRYIYMKIANNNLNGKRIISMN